MQKNILSLDLGRKSLGISISRTGIFVTPIDNFRFPLDRYDVAIKRVLEVMEIEKVETIIIGLPRFKSGDLSEMSHIVLDFVPKLEEAIKNTYKEEMKVITVDEQQSTLEASAILHENNINAKKQKKSIDCVASMVILERYLRSLGQIV